ncbi:MAG TPA: hypothetical protein VHO29_15050 [Marmoricola sp.]|jgi:hypothetical protein|nr:hypothetical protein [Marmoricola sp.]
MRTTPVLGAAAVIATTALLAPAGASAAQPVTVSGTFDETRPVAYDTCVADPTTTNYPSGTWSVTLNSTATAKGTFAMELNGEPHVAYTYPGMKQAPGNTSTSWLVYGKTMAGLLTVTVNGDAMEYRISPYNYGGLSCQSATFYGLVDHD